MNTTQTNQDNPPAILYHYTNLESLALILQNKTLRFNPLNKMDDLQENMTNDIKNIGRFFFASCWTDDAEESIPMWNMYASLNSGVRIALLRSPFVRYRITAEEISELTGMPMSNINLGENGLESFLPFSDLLKGFYSSAFLSDGNILKKIEYTSDIDKLVPQIREDTEAGISLNLEKVGKFKNTKWAFQHEWRYLMSILPVDVFGNPETMEKRFSEMIQHLIKGTLPHMLDYYDLKLDQKAIESIEVIPSPKMSPGNIVLLKQLMAFHGLSDRVKTSELVGLI